MSTKSLKIVFPDKVIHKLSELVHEFIPLMEQMVKFNKRPADVELSILFRKRKELGSRDRRFLSRVIFSYFRWLGWTKHKLKLSLTEALYVSEILESEHHKQWLEFLENKISIKIKSSSEDLSLMQKSSVISKAFGVDLAYQELMPSYFFEHTVCEQEENIFAFQKRPPTWIRSRIDQKLLVDIFKTSEIDSTAHAGIIAAINTSGGVNFDQRIPEHRGKFVIQDISSQCVSLISMPLAGQVWWDCCAGSGGKSLHLADIMQQQGRILATDIREGALQELKKRARIHGIKTIKTQCFNLLNSSQMKHRFDGVLVDAPCTGWGVWGRNPDARWRSSSEDVIRFAAKQLKILSNASIGVKDGGLLIYAVCTISKEETAGVIESFLSNNSTFRLEEFINPIDGSSCNGMLQIYPKDHDGMFIAKMRKNGGVKDGI